MKTTVLILMISIITSCCTEKNVYKQSKKTNTIEGYENYLANYKNGQYALEVSQNIERIKFNKLRDSVFSSFIKIKEDTTADKNRLTLIIPYCPYISTPFNKKFNKLDSHYETIMAYFKLHVFAKLKLPPINIEIGSKNFV